jgi:hypothetical protein
MFAATWPTICRSAPVTGDVRVLVHDDVDAGGIGNTTGCE